MPPVGVQTYYDAVRPFAANNLLLAGLVQQDLVAALHGAGWDVPDRGITLDSSDTVPTFSPRQLPPITTCCSSALRRAAGS